MAKVISEVESVEVQSEKVVKIQHTRVMQNANGNDVTVLDFEETMGVDAAISNAEDKKANLEAQLAEVEAELVEYNAIKDA
jgi:hypothetical protein